MAVDKDRLTRLEDLRNGIGLTIHIAMVGDSCVITQGHRSQAIDVGRDLADWDSLGCGPR